jgi:LmbE family N-acetylglucosaminyl deacetylase
MLRELRGRVAVISPHFDDGVFGCGDLLAMWPGAIVVTVFAGRPPAYGALTAWDAAAGFGEGDDVVAARREEDRAALAHLGATAAWLDFCDSQYAQPVTAEAIAVTLAETLPGLAPAAVIAPLGLFHSDHRLASDASLAARRCREVAWLLYEDAIYRRLPGLVAERLAHLARAGIEVAPAEVGGVPSPRKRAAVACYVSQLRALSRPGSAGYDDAFAPERYWTVAAA